MQDHNLQEWRNYWRMALDNMPAMAVYKRPTSYLLGASSNPIRKGAKTALRICLGYHVYSSGRSNAAATYYNAYHRGAMPRGQGRQNLLRALAGPHGVALARARLIQLGQADRFKIWPKGEMQS